MDYSKWNNLSDSDAETEDEADRRSNRPRVTTLPAASRVTIGRDGNLTVSPPWAPPQPAARASPQAAAVSKPPADSRASSDSSSKSRGINYEDWDHMLDAESDLEEEAPRQYYEDEVYLRLEAEDRARQQQQQQQQEAPEQVAADSPASPLGEAVQFVSATLPDDYPDLSARGGVVLCRPSARSDPLPLVWSQTKDDVVLHLLLPERLAGLGSKAFQVLAAQQFDANSEGTMQFLKVEAEVNPSGQAPEILLLEQLAYPVVFGEAVPVGHTRGTIVDDEGKEPVAAATTEEEDDDGQMRRSPGLEWVDDTHAVDWELVGLAPEEPSVKQARVLGAPGVPDARDSQARAIRIQLQKTKIGQLSSRVVLWWKRCFRSSDLDVKAAPSGGAGELSSGVWEEAHRQFRELMSNRPPPMLIDPETGMIVDPREADSVEAQPPSDSLLN